MYGLNGFTDTLTSISNSISTLSQAAQPYIAPSGGNTPAAPVPTASYQPGSNTPAPTTTSNKTTTYLLIGGGVLAAGAIVFAVTRKKKK